MEHLDKGKPVYDKAHNMLGIVKGEKGKISHVMRLDRNGAQAVVASNAATLAVTAALSQQLDHIAEQLTEISDTLGGMVRDKDRERLSEILAANKSYGNRRDRPAPRDDRDRCESTRGAEADCDSEAPGG